MEIVKLSSKGQFVIPRKIREDLEMEEGSIIGVEKVNDLIVIKKIDTDLVDQIKKSLEDIKHGRIKEWKG
jgi:AbrB family looped-hinge helix DNA binding protein